MKKSELNTKLIDNNANNIKSINSTLTNIDNSYNLKDIIIFDILKTDIPENVNTNNPKFVIIQSDLNRFQER